MALRCAEERRLSLDDRIGDFRVDTAEPNATIRQLLTHTSGAPESLTFAHRPERLAPLWRILRTCTVDSYRESLANLFKRLAMMDSVPGANILTIAPPDEGVPLPEDVDRYIGILQRRATPYAVDGRGQRVPIDAIPRARRCSRRRAGSLRPFETSPSSTSRCGRAFSLPRKRSRRRGALPASNGVLLPHGMGWFVQNYNGEQVVWQFGMTENASSSLMITLPSRGLTLILMANSDGLVKLYSPANGDISLSPFARLFLNLFVR